MNVEFSLDNVDKRIDILGCC